MPSVLYYNTCDIVWHNNKKVFNGSSHTSTIDIWRIHIPSQPGLIADFDRVLSDYEHSRAIRYHQKKDKDRFLVGRIALRLLFAKYLNVQASELEFVIGPNKKPFLKNAEDRFYNTSHSGDFILLAFSGSEIGTDIEKTDGIFSYEEILLKNFSKEEIAFIKMSRQPAENFYLLWTRKEALLKATSKGLDEDLDFVPSLNGLHWVDKKIIGSGDDWHISSFEVAEKYIGSIAFKAADIEIGFFDFNAGSF